MKLITYSVIGMSHFSGLGIKVRLLPRELKMGRSFTPWSLWPGRPSDANRHFV